MRTFLACAQRLSQFGDCAGLTPPVAGWPFLVLGPVTRLQSESASHARMKDGWDASAEESSEKLHLRALFISDVHLGTRTAQAERLLDLLRCCEADVIYLVGDIIDFWKVRRGPHWPQTHNDVLQKLMRKVRKGTRLDRDSRQSRRRPCATTPACSSAASKSIATTLHATAQGRRYVVMHGDEFDVVVRTAKWLALLGDRGYELALWLNHPLELGAPASGPRLLVALGLSQVPRQEGRGFHRRLRGGGGDGSTAPRCRRHHLRPYPPCVRPQRSRDRTTSIAAIGSRAAPPWWRRATASCALSSGRRSVMTTLRRPIWNAYDFARDRYDQHTAAALMKMRNS